MQTFILLLIGMAVAQILGGLATYFFVHKYLKHAKKIIIAEMGIMLLVSFLLIIESFKTTIYSGLALLAGIAIFALLYKIIPHKHETETERMGVLVFIAMCFHEFPEGLATGAMYLLNPFLGLITAVTIALHNIPEGSIATAPYFMEKEYVRGSLAVVITQILFIAGGLVAYYALVNVSAWIQAVCMAFAAGAMLYIIYEERLLLKKCKQ